MSDDIPKAIHSGTLEICGVTLHVHQLDNGIRVIDQQDVIALLSSWENGATMTDSDAMALAKFCKGVV